MIKIQFSTSLEWQSAIIRRVSHSPFSHVDVIDGDGNCLGASNSPQAKVVRGAADGVAARPFNYQLFGIRRIANIKAEPAVEDAFRGFMESQLGKPFDGKALWEFLSPDVSTERDWRDADAWFCSELVTWALERAGLWSYKLLVSKNRVTPADLLLLINPFVSNWESFWEPVPGLKLGEKEK